MKDPADNLDILTAIAQQHAPEHVATWWRRSLADFNSAGGRKSLDACLNVQPYSQQFSNWSAAKIARDEHLRRAHALMPTASVRGFLARLQSFLHHTWPATAALQSPPESLPLIDRELFFAARTGVRLPVSSSQVSEILSGKLGVSPENRTVSTDDACSMAANHD